MIKVKFQKAHLKFILKRHSDFSSFYQVFVEKSYPHLLELTRSGDTIIDAGANIGIFTTIASVLVGDPGSVIAIEPDPDNLAILKDNIRINNLKNVTLIERALYNLDNVTLNFQQDGVMSKKYYSIQTTQTVEFL
ncbi:MAG: FkbM family methyltransferase [Candidatus Parvarchaeota archaeon]